MNDRVTCEAVMAAFVDTDQLGNQQLFDEGVSIECLAAVDEDFPAAEAFRAAG